ncbi:MAG TPA: hypothetical protein VL461_14095 [Dictyobacter sp.]|nr:hypothetical protein [Dictyobacter sp.]
MLPSSTNDKLFVPFSPPFVSFHPQGQRPIHFSLPLHQGHTFNINQTQVVDGQSVTLGSVVVSPTMTRVFLSGPGFNIGMSSPTNTTSPLYQLTAGNWNSTVSGAPTDVSQSQFTNLEISFMNSNSLINQTGEWTLTLSGGVVSGTTSNVTFHFKA